MNRELNRIALCLALVLIAVACAQPSFAQQQEKATGAQEKSNAPKSIEKNKYQQIEVAKFEVKEGVQFPESYLTTLMGELVAQLQETKLFKQAAREGESQGVADAPTIRLTGVVTEFKPGSRAKRYVIGFGAGKTKVVADVKFIDKATGEVLYQGLVDGKVIIGFFGGESQGATRGLAKEVAKVTKQKFFK
jgi:hypothetical protein